MHFVSELGDQLVEAGHKYVWFLFPVFSFSPHLAQSKHPMNV